MSAHDENHELGQGDTANRPHSIDLTLELERQLENESLPNSPTDARPQSLDPHVLASIVMALRMNLTDVTRERDEFAAELKASKAKEHELSGELIRVMEKQTQTNEELEVAQQKNKDDEESIAMLRSKVEESRRGLMRLQTESRRMSANMSVDLSRAGVPSFGGPPSSKRASFTPLTGSGATRMHRRISSFSDSHAGWTDADSQPTSPNSQVLTFPEATSSVSHPPVASRRFSGLFGRTSPPEPLDLSHGGSSNTEMIALRKEVKTLMAALEETRHELTESNEAREASEMCVKALREFIAENNVGLTPAGNDVGPQHPPEVHGDDADRKSSVSGSGSLWGFKLWRVETGGTAPANGEAVSSPKLSQGASPPKQQQQQGEPLAKKLGGFFSGRGSVSSVSTGHRQASGMQEPMFNGSDTSSTAESTEPVSPASEQPRPSILVHENGESSSSSDIGSPERFKDRDVDRKIGLDNKDSVTVDASVGEIQESGRS